MALTLYLSGVELTATVLAVVAVCAIVSTVAEGVGSKGLDNLLIPLMCSITLYYGLYGGAGSLRALILGLTGGGVIALASVRAGFLTAGGAAAAFLMAVCMFAMGGLAWTVPILTFFVLSSLISKVRKGDKEFLADIGSKGARRDHAQVLANGLVAWAAAYGNARYPHALWYALYVSSLAAATADTWATEIGSLSKHPPRSITTWQRVSPGMSGGVTLLGTSASVAGAALVAFSAAPFVGTTGLPMAVFAASAALAGLSGSILDSVLGATVQARYVCPACGKAVERETHCDSVLTELEAGNRWVDNDVVNLACTVWAGAAGVALCALLGSATQ
jgi:uncharacterized protein (TIGR00297 family)